MSNCKLLIHLVQRGQERQAATSVEAEVDCIDGDEETEADTSLVVSLSMVNKSKEYPIASPKRAGAGDQSQVQTGGREFERRRPDRAPTNWELKYRCEWDLSCLEVGARRM